MFKQMRRKKNEISLNETKNLLLNEKRGVLSLITDDGYPYGVPINYLYDENENKIYFHSSKIGQKVESIDKCDKVCFTVYGNETIKQEQWAPYLQSAIVFGRCHAILDQNKAITILNKFANKYYPNEELVLQEIEKSKNAVCMYEIEIEHLSGKQIQEK